MASPADRKRRSKRPRTVEEEIPPQPHEPFCNWPLVGLGAIVLGVGYYFARLGYFSSLILGVGFALLLCGLMMSGTD